MMFFSTYAQLRCSILIYSPLLVFNTLNLFSVKMRVQIKSVYNEIETCIGHQKRSEMPEIINEKYKFENKNLKFKQQI